MATDASAVLGESADLDGSRNVVLAPVRGTDPRRNLPEELFPKKPVRFAAKFAFAVALIVGCWAVIALELSWVATIGAVVVVGLMYAHLVELQHESLHEHAFNSRRLNRVFGFLCGLFMLSSYSHYKYEHLRHHASLGKPNNHEFFNYRFRQLDSVFGFLRAAYHLGRYGDVMRDIARSVLGRPIPRVTRERDARRIRREYRLFLLCIALAVSVTVLVGTPLVALAWLVPLLLVSEPAHFMIELPEHFGLNTQSNPDVLANTRTIDAGRFSQWFTNLNNMHTAHHYHQGIPMANVPRLNELVKGRCEAVEPSYPSFYWKVVKGEIRYRSDDETCMVR
ncbi:MAG: fatty acid desaturase [Actinobacteria bacterium]|nr:fatty acid desaturase [Actinomycetota bacterium]